MRQGIPDANITSANTSRDTVPSSVEQSTIADRRLTVIPAQNRDNDTNVPLNSPQPSGPGATENAMIPVEQPSPQQRRNSNLDGLSGQNHGCIPLPHLPIQASNTKPNVHKTNQYKKLDVITEIMHQSTTSSFITEDAFAASQRTQAHQGMTMNTSTTNPALRRLKKWQAEYLAGKKSATPLNAQNAGTSIERQSQSPSSNSYYAGCLCCLVPDFLKKHSISLRCWVLCPLVAILVTVSILTVTVANTASLESAIEALTTLHGLIVANMEVACGRQTFSKAVRMAMAPGSMYFSNNTFPNPVTDKLMPLENGMMSRLCATLRDMDPAKTITTLGAVSLTRNQAAICVASRSRPKLFMGAQSSDGIIEDFYMLDPATLEYKQPLIPMNFLRHRTSVKSFTTKNHYDTVVNRWNESLASGEVMDLSQYWVTPRYPPMYAAFVFPFFEVYDDKTTGVGYLHATMFTTRLMDMQWYNASETGIRVMLVDPNVTAERLLVFANNWDQPLHNVSNPWTAMDKGEPIKYMTSDDVSDPIMREGLRNIDLRRALISGKKEEDVFPYGGYNGRITAEHIVTESGVAMLLVVVTTRSYYFGPVFVYRDIGIAGGVLVLVLVTGACIAFVECCLIRPLRTTKRELKMALSGAPVGAAQHRPVLLREVRELADVCDTLRRRLHKVRSYMPDRLLVDENATATAGLSDLSPHGHEVDSLHGPPASDLRRVMCSVAYVYYTPRKHANPTNAVVEQMMHVVVGAATACGGCFELQRPDYCVVSFGVQSRGKEFAAEASQAVEFAQRLREELTECAALAGLYRVIVESGAFQSGVISGGGRSHFVLLCRNLHHLLGGFLPHAGVVAAVTEETALLVRGRHRLLPFETVYLEEAGETQVQLHEVLGGDVGTAAWQEYERCYCEAYDEMVRGDYSGALRWWDRAAAVAQSSLTEDPAAWRSSQEERLRSECVARVAQGDTAPYVRRPQPVGGEDVDPAGSVAPSSDSRVDQDTQNSNPYTDSFQTGGTGTRSIIERASRAAYAGDLPRVFKDHMGNTWKRAFEPIDEAVADVTPVYMAISATGTLAVLKVYPLTVTGGRLPRAEVDAALQELLSLGEHDSLVQYLSYCHAPPHGVVLVTEYVPGGTLRDMKDRYGRKLPLMAVKRNVASLLRGLAYLHGRGLVHGHVCPENVMVGVEGRCRLKGMLLTAESLFAHHSSYYVSPEVSVGGAKTAASDMYALGLLLLAMLTNSHPWQWAPRVAVERSQKELDSLLADSVAFREALRGGLLEPIPPPPDVDSAMRGVLEACLCAEPNERLSSLCVLEKLSVPGL
ncbi:protein kinase [Trypanosoma grayi]|uniref:protein kinase n=1 Tax=Trypanosoma grayi TaxID=71804 RepID=UPI0004F44993|nr:protein kinase [Trypanosoma grayi]KEG12876.1 protein kinase [Trypanosoma grayi]